MNEDEHQTHIEDIALYLSEARSQLERIALARPARLAPTLDHMRRTIKLYADLADMPAGMVEDGGSNG